jgi:hypothetical protein
LLLLLRTVVRIEPLAVAGAAALHLLDGSPRIGLNAGQQVMAAELLFMRENLQVPILATSNATFLLADGRRRDKRSRDSSGRSAQADSPRTSS